MCFAWFYFQILTCYVAFCMKMLDFEDGNPSDPVIDLTADDDIQKAIAASLENHPTTPTMLGGQISKEDQDISR